MHKSVERKEVYFVAVAAVGVGAASGGDGGVEGGSQLVAGSVLDVRVETEREQHGAQLEVEAVQQGANAVRGADGGRRAPRPRNSEHIC